MWVAALGAMVFIYLSFEPEVEDVRTEDGGDAPTFVAGEDRAEGGSRLGLEVAEDEGSLAVFRGGVRHTGRSPHRGPARAAQAWRYDARGRITAQPVIGGDGRIYVGSHDHRFHAVSPTGQGLWAVDLRHRVWSAAAVVEDTVYVGSDADTLFALDVETGEPRWRLQTQGDVDGAPAVVGDTLYVTGGRHLYAVRTDGEIRWRFEVRATFLLSSPAVDSDGTVYATSIDDHLYAVAPDGRMRWEYAAEDDIRGSPTIGDDGTIYFGSDDQHVHAVDRDGERRWRTHLDGFVRAPIALGREGDVLVAVYGPRPRVVSLDAATGDERWAFPVSVVESSEMGIASGPLVDVDGNIYFGSPDDYLYAIDADGDLRWIHELGADIDSAPVITEDGTLIVGCDDGFLYAIVEGDPPEEEPADGGVDPDASMD